MCTWGRGQYICIIACIWEGSTGDYLVQGWQYWPSHRESQFRSWELNIVLYVFAEITRFNAHQIFPLCGMYTTILLVMYLSVAEQNHVTFTVALKIASHKCSLMNTPSQMFSHDHSLAVVVLHHPLQQFCPPLPLMNILLQRFSPLLPLMKISLWRCDTRVPSM